MLFQIMHVFINDKCFILRFVLNVLIHLINKFLHFQAKLGKLLLNELLIFVELALYKLKALSKEVFII